MLSTKERGGVIRGGKIMKRESGGPSRTNPGSRNPKHGGTSQTQVVGSLKCQISGRQRAEQNKQKCQDSSSEREPCV